MVCISVLPTIHPLPESVNPYVIKSHLQNLNGLCYDIESLPDRLFVYPWATCFDTWIFESSRRKTIAAHAARLGPASGFGPGQAHAARCESYLRSRMTGNAGNVILLGGYHLDLNHTAILVPTRNTTNSITTYEAGLKGYDQPQYQSRSTHDARPSWPTRRIRFGRGKWSFWQHKIVTEYMADFATDSVTR